MSKIFKLFAAFFVGIYNILDKLIVTPISKLIYKISKLGKSNSSKLETILNRPTVLIYVSLLCAIIVFWLVDRQVILLVDNEAEVITGQTIDVIYNQENYVVEGVPETVDITLIGSRSNLYLAKSIDNHKIELDLTKYTPGTYTVKLKYNQSRKNVSFKLDPSEVKVEISKKESKTFNLSYDLVNEQELDQKLTISSVSLKQNNIIVKGSRKTLDKIASVKALIDVKAAGFTSEGEFDDVDSITLVAFDSEGNKVNNVEMVPGNIKANIKVDSYSAELPVKIVTEGELKSGYAISSINSSVTKVTVYGEKSVIDGLTSIEAKIDVNDLDTDKTYNGITLIRPDGVRYMSENTTSVTITLGSETTKEFTDIGITYLNLANGYGASAVSYKTINVIAYGVQTALDSLEPSSIRATIDLSGYTVGTHEVEINLEIDDPRFKLVASTKTINIKIFKESSSN